MEEKIEKSWRAGPTERVRLAPTAKRVSGLETAKRDYVRLRSSGDDNRGH